MKTGILSLLVALTATTALASPAAEGGSYPTLIKFCTHKFTGCGNPVSIYDKNTFTIAKGAKYADGAGGPGGTNAIFTIFKWENNKIVACNGMDTAASWNKINPSVQNTNGEAKYTIAPGMVKEKDGVKCSYLF